MPLHPLGRAGPLAGLKRIVSMSLPNGLSSRWFSSSSEHDAAALSEAIKGLMRSSAQPVAIVSAFLPEDKEHSMPRFIHAATLSSFTTVSLAPPLVAFSIRQPSRIADALREGAAVLEKNESKSILANAARRKSKQPHFLVHLLSSEQSSISDYFARPGAQPYEVAADINQEEHPFDIHPVQPSQAVDGQLILKNSLGTMACSLVYQLDLASHELHGTSHFYNFHHTNEVKSVLFLAQIHAVERGYDPQSKTQLQPLLYWNQKYCKPSEIS